MFRKVEDFVTAYKDQRSGTLSILGALTDQNMGQSIHADHRTLGRIAWHLVVTIPEMMGRTGLSLPEVDPESPVPGSAQRIREAYERASQELLTAVSTQWEDETLLEQDEMYGSNWPRGFTLSA
ncbi:MAG: DinB family protein, partial [Candidatus Eisenbacteria bacterium]